MDTIQKISAEELRDNAIDYIRDLFQDDAGGHGADHTMRVFRNAMMIAQLEPGCDRTLVMMGALLHDADDHKLFHTVNNANARAFLNMQHLSEDQIDEICRIINSVSFSQNQGKVPETLEAKIVQDADRLDAIGAIGVARTFAFGGEHGRSVSQSVQHFYDKLLRLKDMMNTDAARRIAEERHAFLEAFLDELYEETGEIEHSEK